MSLPTLQVLFAPSVVDENTAGTRFILNVSKLDTGTLGDGALFYDISDDVRSVTTRRGRSRSLDRFSTGIATIVLDNRTRQYDPTNLSGPYASPTLGTSGVVPTRPVIIKATWNSTQYTLFRGFIDSWDYQYDQSVKDATVTITVSDALKQFGNIIGGLPSAASISSTLPGDVDVVVTETEGTVVGVGSVSTGTGSNIPVVAGVEQTPVIGTQDELTGARFTAILSAINWPDNLREIDTGNTKVNKQNATQTVLQLLQEVADTEAGEFLIGTDGTVIFADRYNQLTDAESIASQATFDTTTTTNPFATVEVKYDDELVGNVIRVSRKNTTAAAGDVLIGTTVTVSNPESQSLFGARYLDRELPIPSTVGSDTTYGTDQAKGIAGFLASIYATPELRPSSITLSPQRDEDDLFPQALGRAILERITVKFQVPGSGTLEKDCFIDGVSHDITPESWSTTFDLKSATQYTGFFILDNATFGLLDTNKLAF